MKLSSIKNLVTLKAGRTGLILRKFSPEILMVVGVVGVVGSTVLACRATLKADEVIDDAKNKMDKINQAKEIAANDSTVAYSEEKYNRDIAVTYLQAAGGFVKLYWPAVTLGVVSIGCILGAHGIMRKRNLALVAAYKAVEESFAKYRKRVIEDFGVEKDWEYRTGVRHKLVNEVDENGNKTDEVKVETSIDPNGSSEYARFFDEYSICWSKTPEYNLQYLKAQQNHCNDLLQSRGHVFLNEVYDALGLERSQAGAVVGWVKGHGDDYIDFGIYDGGDKMKRFFVNGVECSVLLDFNVDGVIWDLI